MKTSPTQKKCREIVSLRQNKFCLELFCKDLQTDLDNYFSQRPALSNKNFTEILNNFVHIISHSIDAYSPLRPISRRMRKRLQKSWIT